MNEDKITKLSALVYQLVEQKVRGEDWTFGEVSAALGIAIGLLSHDFALEKAKRESKAQQQPEDEEEEEENEEEFELRDLSEVSLAFDKLFSKLDYEEVKLILGGIHKVPEWLQKEIVERRG